MKKLLIVLSFFSLFLSSNAQTNSNKSWYYRKYKVDDLTQLDSVRLKKAYNKATASLWAGRAIALIGTAILVDGVVASRTGSRNLGDHSNELDDVISAGAGVIVAQTGFLVACLGTTFWVIGGNHRRDVKKAMNPVVLTGSINQIGITVNF